jgi:hypothetical protein
MKNARLLLPVLTVLLAGCGSKGSYALRWTIGCSDSTSAKCQVAKTKDCSQVGLDSIEAVASVENKNQSELSVFPCFTIGDGPLGRGPELDVGLVDLSVSGLSAGGQVLTGPVDVTAVSIPETGFVEVWVTLPTPPACSDGVDNDGDGLVDMMDPDCKSESGTKE